MNIEEIEQSLRSLLKGEFSSLTLTFNDGNGPNYMSVRDWIEDGPDWSQTKWVSDEDRKKGVEHNSMWELQWYPNTPVSSYRIAAASLPSLFRYLATFEEKSA